MASELGRRNVYAQPTFGHLKKTDLLIMGDRGKVLKIEAKGKQEKQSPNCKGIPDNNSVMVFVDFAGKTDKEPPDFYVLTLDDRIAFVKNVICNHPDKRIELDSKNVPVWKGQVKGGKPFRGIGIEICDVAQHKERWGKITELL